MNIVKSNHRILIIDGKQFELDHGIKDVRLVNDLAVVIYNYDVNTPRHRQFRNCKAFDTHGNLVWTAEHPTNMTTDFYIGFMKGPGNKLWNFGGFICQLDFNNGKLKNTEYTK